ncbi:MAG TPA: molybdate ABC transporter substrate-binding protein [Opitutaceae bacterium]
MSFSAEKVAVAAAANLAHVIGPLNDAFHASRPAATATDSLASSGALVAQIASGAPFDVFLAADMGFARALVDKGAADGSTLAPYAVGRLVLWTAKPGLVLRDVSALRGGGVRRFAIANPATAPYGRAAKEALVKLGLWDGLQPKLVTAGDITQAAQFVETGNVDAGFVALSAVLSPSLRGEGSYAEVPPNLYAPIVQGMVLTMHGKSNAAAAAYLAFMRGPEAGRILRAAGYGIPALP